MVSTSNSECHEGEKAGIWIAQWSVITNVSRATRASTEGIKMEFATSLLVSDGLMAAFIYIVVSWIWED